MRVETRDLVHNRIEICGGLPIYETSVDEICVERRTFGSYFCWRRKLLSDVIAGRRRRDKPQRQHTWEHSEDQ